jgi:Fe-S-cluster-containing hydrogenase component 2
MGICTLCDGDPKCVKYCSYSTLSYIDVTKDREYYGMPPQKIAQLLYDKIYMKSN